MKHAILSGFILGVWLAGTGAPALLADSTNATRLAVADGGMIDSRAAAAPVTLTVLNFQNRQTGDGYEWLQRAFPDMLLTHFVQHGKFTVVERERMQVLLDELKLAQTGVTRQDDAAKFAGIAKVQKVVYGHYAVEHGRLSVTAFIFDATSNTVDAVATADGGLDSLCDIEHQLFSNLLGRLGAPLTETDQGKLRCVVSSSLSAAAHFYDGMGAFDAGDYPEALVQFQQAGRQDSRYGEARLWTARMYSYLGEPAHAVIELRQFTSDLPEHPLTAQAHLRAGLTLLQDLQQPRLAATEFKQLIAMEPAVQESPVALRQAHWDEYRTLYRGLRSFIWVTPEQQAQSLTAAEKLEVVGRTRARQFDLYVEGWYRLGQCYEVLGDAGQAFGAYDQGRAVCRWLLLDQSGLTDRLYGSTYGLYHQVLTTEGITLPIPDWVWPMEDDQPQTIFDKNQDQMDRYVLDKAQRSQPANAAVVLLAPPGRQFVKLTTQVYGDGETPPIYKDPRKSASCLRVEEFGRLYYMPPSESTTHTNCVTVTTQFEPSGACRACKFEAFGLDRGGKLTTLIVSAFTTPWTGKIHKNPTTSGITQALVYKQPTSAVLRIDGRVVLPVSVGSFGYGITPGQHRFELADDRGRKADAVVNFDHGSCHMIYLTPENPWHDSGVRLPPGHSPDLCRAPDGEYWLVYVATVGAGPGQSETGDDIWLVKSRDLRQWSKPFRLPINSAQADGAPRLMVLPDGRMQLAFISDRRQSGTAGLYLSQSTDGRAWSVPRRFADAAFSLRARRGGDGRYWLRTAAVVWESQDGVNWQKASPAGLKDPDWAEGAVVADGRLQTLPLPDLTPVSFSPILQLPDRSFVVVASQSISFCKCANTHIYVTTEEDLRRVITTSPGKVDQ